MGNMGKGHISLYLEAVLSLRSARKFKHSVQGSPFDQSEEEQCRQARKLMKEQRAKEEGGGDVDGLQLQGVWTQVDDQTGS